MMKLNGKILRSCRVEHEFLHLKLNVIITVVGKCLFLSGLIPEQLNAYDDYKLVKYGIGFTNIVARTTRGSADLTRFAFMFYYRYPHANGQSLCSVSFRNSIISATDSVEFFYSLQCIIIVFLIIRQKCLCHTRS
jgi:hypothetical protein